MYDNRSFNPFGYFSVNAGRGKVNPQNLSSSIAPIQFQRWAADIKDWRDAMSEMEQAFYPFRVKSTRIYIDTAENVFVKALIERMQELVLQREPIIYQYKSEGKSGTTKKVISRDLTQQLNSNFWFKEYRKLILDAILWGFRIIELGELDTSSENIFPNLTFTRPENIRIDLWRGALLTSIPYYIDGIEIQDKGEIEMWNHYISTKSNRGVSPCGYGMLYNISEYAIHLKHLLGWRLDFIENYGQPTRVGTTNKTGSALKKFEQFLANPTANSYVLLNRTVGDEFRFEESSAGTGTAWKSHGDAATFLKKELSQLGLGHEDAFITSAGKVGANVTQNKDGFNESSMEQAINQKRNAYSNFEIAKINEVSIPAFRKLSKNIGYKPLDFVPEGYRYGLTNDKEDQEITRRFNSDMESKSKWILGLYNGGLQISDVTDFNAMIPEIPGGFIKVEPSRKLDENRTGKTTIDSVDKPNAPNEKID
ncbi:MAG: hypothetical protein ABIS69_09110 [Sediminibacterium sp.]